MSLLKNPQSDKNYCFLVYLIIANFAINFLSHTPVYFFMHITDSSIQDINCEKNLMFSSGLLLRTKPADGSGVVCVIRLYLNSQVFFKLVYANLSVLMKKEVC